MGIVLSLILVVLGLLLAFAGRRFIWLLVGAAGFLFGFWLVNALLPGNSFATLLLALAAGLVAAFFVRGATRLVLSIIAFILVGSAAVAFGGLLGISFFSVSGIITFLAGGILGVVLVRFVGAIGLMIVTALAGAALVKMGLPDLGVPLGTTLMNLVGPVVAVLGFVVQYSGRNR
jgi:hypothetical protein